MRVRFVPALIAMLAVGVFVPGMFAVPTPSQAMPTFAQSYGIQCSTCHTQVPLLNAYGRYVQRTAYAALDRHTLARANPVWLGENLNYDSTAGAGTGLPRFSFGNFAIHAAGFITPDITYHAQQWVVQNEQHGGVDTLWVSYNNLFNHNGHLVVGKQLNPAPSPYSQTFDIDGPSASSTIVGEHDWAATYGNRWGAKLAYVRGALDAEAGYYLTGDDLQGISDFSPGDKTLQWKLAYAPPKVPVEAGFFGSNGSLPVSTGTNHYNSVAAYVQIDPNEFGRPGLLAIHQVGGDSNPGVDTASGLVMPATISHGTSIELYEPIFKGNAVIGVRRDFSNDGYATLSNGTSINLGFNVPSFQYLHGYVEANMGGNSSLLGASGGPTWKGMLWLTLPVKNVK